MGLLFIIQVVGWGAQTQRSFAIVIHAFCVFKEGTSACLFPMLPFTEDLLTSY